MNFFSRKNTITRCPSDIKMLPQQTMIGYFQNFDYLKKIIQLVPTSMVIEQYIITK